MNALKYLFLLFLLVLVFSSCSKKENDPVATPVAVSPHLIFKFKFDSTQSRLNSFGQVAVMQPGHSGQSPSFNKMSAHYIELAQDSLTALGSGCKLFHASETMLGGATAIDFDNSVVVGEGQEFFSVPFSSVTSGTYRWLRVSLAYQNYDIHFLANGFNLTGTIASFIGFNTYIRSYYIHDSLISVNANRSQGYWGFETSFSGNHFVSTGQAAPGATTVPNPIANTSPIPAGSCVVTGAFTIPFVVTGNETHDVIVIVSLSTNKSFEWKDLNANGIFEPRDGDTVVDMGVRGLIPIVQ